MDGDVNRMDSFEDVHTFGVIIALEEEAKFNFPGPEISLAGVLIREFDKVTIRGYFVELLSKMEPRAVVCVWWWSTRTWVTC